MQLKPAFFEFLELRTLLSAAFDLTGVTALRNDPTFKNIDGRGVSVVVIDTGLDTSHPLIKPNYITGADIVGGGSTPTVTNPHGTHVAGIVGSKPDPARGYDGGVAPGVGIIALNVFSPGAGGDVTADNRSIEKALQWVEDNQTKYNIVAVNMSLGGGFYTSPDEVAGDVYADEISTLQKNGVTIVSAAGNSYGLVQNPDSGQLFNVSFPNSGSPGILSTLDVGAVWDKNEGGDFIWGNGSVDLSTGADRITSFSQRPPPAVGNGIFAPGAIITSTWPGNQLQQTQGTSQASPMVAGAVALLQNAAQAFGGRFLSPVEVRNVLLNTGDTINDGDNEDDAVFIDSNGNGRVDSGEFQSLKNTGLNYPRLNIYRALKTVAAMFGVGGSSGLDANGTIANAILGPTLNGAPVDAISGILGSDGTKSVGNRDIDMYQFTVAAPGQVTIEVASDPTNKADFDSFLRLFNASGKQLASDNDGGAGSFSQIKITLQPGTYFAGVTGTGNTVYDPLTAKKTNPGKSGNFRIGFSLKSTDPNGLISGAVSVNLTAAGENGALFDGNIGTDFGTAIGTEDVDLFKIVVPDNGQLMIDIDTPFDDGFVDSYLRAFDGDGNAIGASDNNLATDAAGDQIETTAGVLDYDLQGNPIGHITDSFVIGDVARGDVYYIGVSDESNRAYDPSTLAGRGPAGAGGLYELTITFANNDTNGSIQQAVETTSLPVHNVLGSIGTDLGADVGDRDVDMFKITPVADGILNVKVDSYSLVPNSNIVDTVLKLFAADGKLLATGDDVNGPDPLLQISILANTDYFVAVAGKGNENFDPFVLGSGSPGDTGFYHLSVDLLNTSSAAGLSDDKISDGALQTVTFGSRVVASVGMDNGFVRGNADVDLYKLVAPVTGATEIRAGNIDAFGVDTFLRLFDSTGKQIASNDNDGAGTVNSRIQANLAKGTTYYIGVSGKGNSSYNPSTGGGAKAGATGQYVLALDGGFATIKSKQLRVSGSASDDNLSVSHSGSKMKAIRNGATLVFSASDVTSVSVAGGDGKDVVVIGAGVPASYIDGGVGNDSLSGGDGNDTLTGGAGKNTLAGNAGNDRLNGSGGRDLLLGGAGDDRLYGNNGNDTLDGGGNVDRLFAGDGDDSLLGGSSNDKLYGEGGSDTLNGQGQADLLDGGAGKDFAVNDVLDTRTSIEKVI